MNMDTIMRLAKEKVDTVTVQELRNVCDYAVKEEKKFHGHDAVPDNITERFIINANDTSDESENYEDAISGVDELL